MSSGHFLVAVRIGGTGRSCAENCHDTPVTIVIRQHVGRWPEGLTRFSLTIIVNVVAWTREGAAASTSSDTVIACRSDNEHYDGLLRRRG